MATEHAAKWATGLEFAHLPFDVVYAATCSFYNWVGCVIGGATHPATVKAFEALESLFGPLNASVTFDCCADPQHAALLNGIASHVHDYDDTHLDTIIHPTGPVASALLAAVEWKKARDWAIMSPIQALYSDPRSTSGKDFLAALVAGIEVECKAGLAVTPEHYHAGWHITSTVGSMGAAVAVGKVLGLNEEEMMHAIGLAATQVTGLQVMFGSDTKSFHIGRAAQNGFMAVVLAKGGFTSSERALEANSGWARAVAPTKEALDASLRKWFGPSEDGLVEIQEGEVHRQWEILRNSFKPFPCGIVMHPVIDGCIQLHKELTEANVNLMRVETITAFVHPLVLDLTGKREPRDGLEAKFSVFHGAACGLFLGAATPHEFIDEVVQDDFLIWGRDRVKAVVNQDLQPDQAEIHLLMEDGRTFIKRVEHCVGSIRSPMDGDMLHRKFIDQFPPDDRSSRGEAASEALIAIATLDDVTDIMKSIIPS